MSSIRLAKPNIVHISSHGDIADIVYLEDDSGMKTAVSSKLLESLFSGHERNVFSVILNFCHSSNQAEAIARHIKFAIGMNGELTDESAIAFSRGFYQSYGSGDSIEEAFHQGCLEVLFRESGEEEIPVIFYRSTLQ